MKQIFFDPKRDVYIKYFSESSLVEKELHGVKYLSPYLLVPKVIKLDSKVLAIKKIEGVLGYQIEEKLLNQQIALYLLKVKPISNIKLPSIFKELRFFKKYFKDNIKLLMLCIQVEKELGPSKLYPVHGDLQKLNIIIADNRISLIDFEHFILAPRELEVANSLFFSDGNCVSVLEIVKLLPKGFFSLTKLKNCIKFYTLEQIKQGMNEEIALQKMQFALHRSREILE